MSIPNLIPASLVTVADIHVYLVADLTQRGEAVIEIETWNRLESIVADAFRVSQSSIVPSARIAEDLKVD